MARRRTKIRKTYRKARASIGRRRPKKNDMKRYAKKAALGAGAGLAVSIPLTLAGKHFGVPELAEVGQRVGSVASAAMGGAIGNAAYQGADALFDRFVVVGGASISGSKEVYL